MLSACVWAMIAMSVLLGAQEHRQEAGTGTWISCKYCQEFATSPMLRVFAGEVESQPCLEGPGASSDGGAWTWKGWACVVTEGP